MVFEIWIRSDIDRRDKGVFNRTQLFFNIVQQSLRMCMEQHIFNLFLPGFCLQQQTQLFPVALGTHKRLEGHYPSVWLCR